MGFLKKSNVLDFGIYEDHKLGNIHQWSTQEALVDAGKIIMPSAGSNGGWGFVQIGDNQEWAFFSFTSAGVVTLMTTSGANVGTTEDNDTTFNIYDASSVVGFNNELGSTLNLHVNVWYN